MNSLSFISKYGFKPIAVVVLLAFISYIADFEVLENLFIILALVLIYVYRDTSRHVFENNQSILSPIDGKVLAIDKLEDKVQLYIKVSLCSNHNLRAPFNGKLEIVNTKHGVNLDPNTPKGRLLNEQVDMKFINDDTSELLSIKLISGFCNPAIELKEGIDKVSQGDKIGFFIDGLVIITLDKNKESLVKIGDKIKASQSIIAKIG